MIPVVEHRIWITQVLCPNRHCIVATGYDVAEMSTKEASYTLGIAVGEAMKAGELDPWCAICGARYPEWHADSGPTQWATMAAAAPFIKEIERQNLYARSIATQRGDRQ